MSPAHTEQLVYTETDDGYLLEGAMFTPAAPTNKPTVVWMHGFTGRFYEQHQVTIGRSLADRGYPFITGNNRGHHVGAYIVNLRGGAGLLAGGWWEDFAECRLDYPAWIKFACDQGASQVILAGHSLGCVKAIYYLGEHGDDRVSGLIAASGPVHLAERLAAQPDRLVMAQTLLDEGRGTELLPADPGGRVTSAQTLILRDKVNVDFYGVNRTDAPLTRVDCPILFILGSEEPEIATQADLPLLTKNARDSETLYVEGADHLYKGREQIVADGIFSWLEKRWS